MFVGRGWGTRPCTPTFLTAPSGTRPCAPTSDGFASVWGRTAVRPSSSDALGSNKDTNSSTSSVPSPCGFSRSEPHRCGLVKTYSRIAESDRLSRMICSKKLGCQTGDLGEPRSELIRTVTADLNPATNEEMERAARAGGRSLGRGTRPCALSSCRGTPPCALFSRASVGSPVMATIPCK